jgi:hypothetical protein
VRDNIPIDSETLLVTDFVNLKIKPTQSFKVVYRVRIYTRILIEMSAHDSVFPLCFSIKQMHHIVQIHYGLRLD